MRNILFDLGWLPSYKPNIKTIAIGNLSTGGTGKTPFAELLIRLFHQKFRIAVISRGYGRKTKGFIWVEQSSDASDVGDEPLQIKQKYSAIKVAVCEKRADAIKKIETENPEINLIIMDDAFQHRHVRAHIYILLSTYNDPFYSDYVLPTGNLRERRKGVKRADFIVMTKCPTDLSPVEKGAIKSKIKPMPYQNVFFAREKYGKLYDLFTKDIVDIEAESAFLISGIADSMNLKDHIGKHFENLDSFKLTDHVKYNKSLITRIKKKYKSLNDQFLTWVITTEKDAVKLKFFKSELSEMPFFVIPFEHDLFDEEIFAEMVEDKILT